MRPAWMAASSLALALALGAPSGPALAQQDAGVAVGEEVRIRAEGTRGRFRVTEVGRDALSLARGDASTVIVPMDSISALWVARGKMSAGAGAWYGFVRGAAIGAAFGALVGLASGDDEPGFMSWSAEEKAVLGVIVVGGIAGGAGLLFGAVTPPTRWERVPIATLRPTVGANGTFGLSVSLRF